MLSLPSVFERKDFLPPPGFELRTIHSEGERADALTTLLWCLFFQIFGLFLTCLKRGGNIVVKGLFTKSFDLRFNAFLSVIFGTLSVYYSEY